MDAHSLILGLFATVTAAPLPCRLVAQTGALDPDLDADGIVITDLAHDADYAFSLVVQPDGRFVLAGYTYLGSNYMFAVVRYLADGATDSTFGANGVALVDVGEGNDQAQAVALQPDGKLVVAGSAVNGLTSDFALVRLNADGSLDGSFGEGGTVTTDFGIGSAVARSVALQPDGMVVLAGSWDTDSGDVIAMARYTADGALDDDFGTAGKVTTDISAGSDRALAVALQPDGKLVVAGVDSIGPFADFAVVRYNGDGTLDNSFGTDGTVSTDLGSGSGTGSDWAYAVAIQPDGRIVAAGYGEVANNFNFAAVRYLTDGTLDNSFSGDGRVSTSFNVGTDAAHSMALQADGRIVLAGASSTSFLFNFALLRYNADGTLDDTFGVGGKVVTPLAALYDEAYAVAIQPDGKILAAGYAYNGSDNDIAVVRYLNDLNVGLLDLSVPDNSVLVFPNPIHGEAILQYELAREERITIQLLDLEGRVLQTFLDGHVQPAGPHQQAIALPRDLASGAYLIVISSTTGRMGIRVEN